MQILFFSDNFRPETNPPASSVFERARLWVRQGHQVTVITCAPNFPDGVVFEGYKNSWRFVEEIDGIRVVRVKTFIARNEGFVLRILDYISYVLPALHAALRESRPDVVISTSPQLFVPVAGLAYAALRRLPHVFELRDLWPASILATGSMKPGRIYRLLERLELSLYRRSARIISVTRSFVADLTERGISESKIDVVLNGANLELFRPRKPDLSLRTALGLENRFVIGYLGTLGLAHGLENVLNAAEIVRDTPITFLFVGSGAAQEKLQRIARERNLTNVVFAPRQAKEMMPRFWSVCDVSLIHLRNAPLFETVIPSKIFESMAMGLPILYCGPAGEATQLVEQHQAGVIVAPEVPDKLADAACRLLGNPEQRARIAENSRSSAPLYSRNNHARQTLLTLERARETFGATPIPALGEKPATSPERRNTITRSRGTTPSHFVKSATKSDSSKQSHRR